MKSSSSETDLDIQTIRQLELLDLKNTQRKWLCRIAENEKLAVLGCRKHKMEVPELGQKNDGVGLSKKQNGSAEKKNETC